MRGRRERRPRAGDRSPRGRIAGARDYLLSLTQSVKASSPLVIVAQSPLTERSR